jgi:hypothetical protein
MKQLVRVAELGERLHVPEVVLVDVNGALAREKVERSQLEVVDVLALRLATPIRMNGTSRSATRDSLASGHEAELHGSSRQLSGRSTRQRPRHGGSASASELVSRSTLAP